PARLDVRRGAGPERRRVGDRGGAGRVEGHDVQAGSVDRAPRVAAGEVAYLADAAIAPQERLLEVHDYVHACRRLPGHRQRAPADQQVRPGVPVLRQFLVGRVRQAGVGAGGDGVERTHQGEEVELAQLLLLRVALDAAGLDQDRGHAGLLGQVAERARVEGVVPLRHVAGDVGLKHRADGDRDLDRAGARRIDLARLVVGRREQRDGGAAPAVAGAGADVLVVQVEAEGGLEPFAQAVQGTRLGRGKGASVAVDVDALRVAALEAGRAVGVHDRQEVQGGPGADALHQRVVRV